MTETEGAAGPLLESVGASLGNIEGKLVGLALDADVKSVLIMLSSIQSQVQSNGSGLSDIKSALSSIQAAIAQIPTTAGGGSATDLTPVLSAVAGVKASVDEILTDLEGNPAPTPTPAPTP